MFLCYQDVHVCMCISSYKGLNKKNQNQQTLNGLIVVVVFPMVNLDL